METLRYDAVKVVTDEYYFNAVWKMFRDWYNNMQEDFFVSTEEMDKFGEYAKLQVNHSCVNFFLVGG